MRFSLLFAVMILLSAVAYGQSDATETTAVHTTTPAPYYIQFLESKDSNKLFPKLYAIGFVIKEQDVQSKKTKYYLGDFKTEAEATEILAEVRKMGYAKAQVIKMD